MFSVTTHLDNLGKLGNLSVVRKKSGIMHVVNYASIVIDTKCSDVKRGQNLEAEARATRLRLRPIPSFWRLRPRPRPKIIMKKYQIMNNNMRCKIIAGKN